MSKKFTEKLLQSGPNVSKKFHSSFGASILAKYGWKEGQGLGKDENGIVDPVSLKKVTGNPGLGTENKKDDEWSNWWDDMYNKLAAKVDIKADDKREKKSESKKVT
ncbi:conserved hypothetical protein [Theileria equi strain WA]|uniref:G-patch domain-containing protein n=1 Tax=Theileria equi strain WA TaxID=1537102 RepID=L1LF23_THEEQ|nr:conserved hypothetical protein [Theileria equi strain WA]EKX73884.1 conserved hypothetical protein [Theileria equi strain WA]|eukprot:XP_004833336.1 conserved hypothetical protein [Theileria equi strain WA]